ncbi:MAG: tyrosine-type recombinase/integrase [Candidatus Cloacimonadales bacterium]
MNFVEPIRDVKKIERMKKLMRKEGKLKELVLFELGIKTGLRVSDILNLKWSSVFSGVGEFPSFREVITIKEQKTRKSKRFHLPDNVRKVILELWESNKLKFEDYIFLSESNNVVSKSQAWSRQYVWQFLIDFTVLY